MSRIFLSFGALIRRYPYLTIFLVALSIRLAYLNFIYVDEETFIVEDSLVYTQLSSALLKTGGFHRMMFDGEIVDETERVPVYIVFLAFHEYIFKNNLLISVVSQMILDSVCCLLIALIAGIVSPRLSLYAGLLAAANPTMIIYSATILTDSLFLFFVCCMFYFIVCSLYSSDCRFTALLGLSIGLATMTRTLIVLWPIFLIPILFLCDVRHLQRKRISQAFVRSFVTVSCILACLAPILYRNITKYDTCSLTSQNGTYALGWVLPLTWEVTDGIPWSEGGKNAEELFQQDTEVQKLMKTDPDAFQVSQVRIRVALRELARISLFGILKTWSIGATMNFLAPSILQLPNIKHMAYTHFFQINTSSKLDKINKFIFHNSNPVYTGVLLSGIVGAVLIRLLQLIGLWSWFASKEKRFLLLISIAWIFYILGVNGPIAAAKYRLPIEPILTIYLAVGIDRLIRRLRRAGQF